MSLLIHWKINRNPYKDLTISWAWWCVPIILALQRRMQEDQEIRLSILSSIVNSNPAWATRDFLKNKQTKNPNKKQNQVSSPRNNTWGGPLTSVYLCTLMHVYICPYLNPPTPTHTRTPFSPLTPLSKPTANLSSDFNIVLQKTYLCVCGVYGWSQRPGDRSFGDEVTSVCEPLYGRWDLSSSPHD